MTSKFEELGLTYDDILLVPQKSSVLPKETSLKTKLTKKLYLNIPILSAAMDTVTEYQMAIALAQLGGLGIIHKNMTLNAQLTQVQRVKRSESGLIVNPMTISPTQPISVARELIEKQGISGLPVIDNDLLIGILTKRDLWFEKDWNKKVEELMTPADKLITAPVGTSQEQAQDLMHKYKVEKLPIIDEEMHLKGLYTIKDLEKQTQFPDAIKDDLGRLLVGVAIGAGDEGVKAAEKLLNAGADIIVVDSAHGHQMMILKTVEAIKRKFPDSNLIAGNVVTREGTRDLIDAGADAVKIGVGPGSICTTRIIAGVGMPQISAIIECFEAAEEVPIIADGGIKYSGDIVKALALGASTVMLGGMLAGIEESPGEIVIYQGRSFKTYRGMGSIGAMKKGSSQRYFQEGEKLVPEGIEGRVPYKGKLSDFIFQLIGGIKSGMGYVGANNLESLRSNARFVRITSAGLRESHPHDVIITKESPNYNP
ncbi:MAG: IMP dehydrogenase [Candidatus Coatesbacteria bacterium]|nr:IMP dehydrogenase [Candidatus Coatesbacteria bacterium]